MANAKPQSIKRRDEGKERFWRGVMARWRRSGLGVRDFCDWEDLSEASFYAWRRELSLRDREKQPVASTKEGKADQQGPSALFVPVRIEDDAASNVANSTASGAASDEIRILVGAGQEVRVGSRFDSHALMRVLLVMQELASASDAKDAGAANRSGAVNSARGRRC